MHKTLIEEGGIDQVKLLYKVSAEAKKEKLGNAKPPINEICYWWTRKPLIVGRVVALASTLEDSDMVYELLGLLREKRSFNYKPNIETYAKYLGKIPSEIKVLDPFAGAGNLIFPAQELGLKCTAVDYNPLAYTIMKSVLEYPSKYGTKLADDVAEYGKRMIEITQKELSRYFSRSGRNALTYLWVWCIKCNFCRQRVPLTNHMWLFRGTKKRIGIKFILTTDFNFKTELITNITEKEGREFTQMAGKAICIRCRSSINYEQITREITKNKDREMIAVVVQGAKAKDYELPTLEDKQCFISSRDHLNELWNYYDETGILPSEDIRASHRRENLLWHYGIDKWHQFFSERQLLVMLTISKNIREICKGIPDKEYAKIIATYMALVLCKHINYNSLGVAWHKGNQQIVHALSFRRPSIVYNHAEVNPFEKTSGSVHGMLNDVTDAIRFSSTNRSPSDVRMGSVLHLSERVQNEFDLIITDPPYSDDVQYGELSEFFYVWVYRILKDFYPELPSRIPLEEDISVAWGRFGNLQIAKDFYQKAMQEAFKQIYQMLRDDGLLVLFFAHSSTEAWNLLLQVLRIARLRVVSSFAVHTENTSNVIARGKTSFMSSIVVACRKMLEENTVYFEDLLPQIEDKVKNILTAITLEQLLELPMTDLLIMTYGKVLEETTQHTVLKSYRSDFNPQFENLIKDAREFILREIVTKLTGRSHNILGSYTSFYVVTKIFYKGLLDSNEALKVGLAYQIDTEELERREIAKRESGITRLMFFDETHLEKNPDEIDKNNLHKQLMYIEDIAYREGTSRVKSICSQHTNFRVHDLKQLVNLLLTSYRMRLNKKETLTTKEQKEMKILESLADIFGSSIASIGGKTLEEFMG